MNFNPSEFARAGLELEARSLLEDGKVKSSHY